MKSAQNYPDCWRDFTHLDALELGLSHERARLASAKTESEKALRAVWIAQKEREIAGERAFLGLGALSEATLSHDELLAELSA